MAAWNIAYRIRNHSGLIALRTRLDDCPALDN
jgi:hypothetical protein